MIKNDLNIEKLFKEYYEELCILSYYYTRDFDESEDIIQDIFFTIISKNKMDSIQNLKAYLKTAVKNASFKSAKKQSKKQVIDDDLLSKLSTNTLTKEQEMIAIEKKILIHKEIENLPEGCKRVFLLCCSNDLKYAEAADALEISINTVKSQMKKAFKILRLSLENA